MLAQATIEDEPMVEGAGHRPVLLRETLALLSPRPGRVYVDATVGAGGHAEALLQALGESGTVIGIDRDPYALARAELRLARFGTSFVPIRGNHQELGRLLDARGTTSIDGILFDLGVSSLQLDDPERGFSFRADGPLDMRMDPRTELGAAELLATLGEAQLDRILRDFGEERRHRAIARAIVRERSIRPLTRTLQLAEIVERTLGPASRRFRIHPATRTFQALRIAVNGEIEGLPQLIDEAASRLRAGGRIAAISFHSLEDRAIKRAFHSLAHRCTCPSGLPVCGCGRRDVLRVLTSKPVRPSPEESRDNPRARSAKLRAAERL